MDFRRRGYKHDSRIYWEIVIFGRWSEDVWNDLPILVSILDDALCVADRERSEVVVKFFVFDVYVKKFSDIVAILECLAQGSSVILTYEAVDSFYVPHIFERFRGDYALN